LGTAQTGTGKTAAFVLPVLNALANENRRPNAKSCRALILAPTRELAAQIVDSVRDYGKGSRVSVTLVVGGLKISKQIRALERGVDIVVATPGRLLDLAAQKAIRFDQVTTVVLDEADHMMDMGFLPQIKKILVQLPTPRQTVLLSATMPKDIRKLADQFLKNPVSIAVAQESKPVERIDQSVRFVPHAQKRDVLTEILRGPTVDSAIVFTRTKRGADRVCQHLSRAGLAASAIHGNKSQNQRTKALDAFKSKKLKVLVATDIAARGIDIDMVSHVVNYELPNVPESYVHRIGRTARAGESGTAITLCDGEERKLLRDIEKLIGNRLPGNEAGAAQEPINDREAKSFHPSKDGQRRRKPRNGNRNRKPNGHRGQGKSAQHSQAS
ncbi:MAG: DEAD/DEAH box helicase, partial [Henriciella sp.]|uniref:DEAD/DEAH box helicase n=1 Tax=Henriciella sp. TaxID=1968823 RepID=UPI003C719FEA